MTTKTCNNCEIDKPLSDYSKRQGKCKECRSEKRKQHCKEVEKPINKEQLRQEQLRQEFKDKHNLKPEHDMLEISFTTPTRKIVIHLLLKKRLIL